MLATIVERVGSAPRGVGTAMVVAQSGALTGTVGGGSMEHRARQDALELLSENTCAIHSYDIHADASGSAAGRVTILFRSFSGEAGEELSKLIRISLESAREAYLVCELANGYTQESSLLSFEQLCSVCGLSCPPEEAILTDGEPRWLIEPILPVPRVVLFGGGHVAQCMARQLALLAYRIWVVEDREAFARQELFPMAERVILSDYDQVEPLLSISKRDHGIVMSRGHETDEQILCWLLRSEADYIGCIGSRRKIAQIREHLLAKGLSQAQIERLHAPIGLDIGAETPAQIAVSVAAELIRYCSAR